MRPFALLLLCTLQLSRLIAAPARPNVLFVIADDLTKSLPCYGYPLARAPNVDRLAARAVRFDRAYCQYPVCSPSRVSFLSGRRPEHTGMYGNEGTSRTPLLRDAVFLPQHFHDNGYFTARLGKVFHIGRDLPECWDITEEGTPENKIISQPPEVDRLELRDEVIAEHAFGRNSPKGEMGGGEGSSYTILKGGEGKLVDVHNRQRAVELLAEGAKRNKDGQPFFLAVGFRRPHLPHLAPQRFFDAYPAVSMPVPPGGPKIPAIRALVPDDEAREALRGYLAALTFMDEQLGHVLDAMDQHKLWDNTIVFFLGDHGYLLGSRGGWWGKGVLYNEAASTTLLVAAPGRPKATGCERIIEFLDFYPTLVELCHLPAAKGVEGRSFAPLLANPRAPWDHVAYTMTAVDGQPRGLGVSTERYRYLEHDDGRKEFFDLQADPREWKDLAAAPDQAAQLAQMKALADAYKAKFRQP